MRPKVGQGRSRSPNPSVCLTVSSTSAASGPSAALAYRIRALWLLFGEFAGVAAAVSAPFSVVSGGLLCVLGLAVVAWRYPELAAYDAHRAAAEAERLSKLEAATT